MTRIRIKDRRSYLSHGEKRAYIKPAELRILLTLMFRRFAPYPDLIEIMWPCPDRQPLDTNGNIGVSVCRLRRALESVGSPWKINTRARQGIELERI